MEQTVTLTDLYEFKRCSLRFKLTKVDKVTSVMNAKDGLHEALHSTINYFYYAMLDGKFLSMNDLGAYLTRDVKHQYTKNYKTILIEIKEDLKELYDIHVSEPRCYNVKL